MRLTAGVLLLTVGSLAPGWASSPTIPLTLEVNQGQAHEDVLFIARRPSGSIYLTRTELVAALPGESVRMRWVGANPDPKVEGVGQLPHQTNYFRGTDPDKWLRSAPSFERVRYSQVYPGVDLEFYENNGELEYDFIVEPGADPDQIRLKFEGPRALSSDGALSFITAAGRVDHRAPFIYQEVAGERRRIEGSLQSDDRGQYRFEVGDYARDQRLVIDPTINFAALLGTVGSDVAFGVFYGLNYLLMCGDVSEPGFPLPGGGSAAGPESGDLDIFLAVFYYLASTGSHHLINTTIIGGPGRNSCGGIEYDRVNREITIAGRTERGFPMTDIPEENNLDPFVAKVKLGRLEFTSSRLIPVAETEFVDATSFGGPGNEFFSDLARDQASGRLAYTGGTQNPFMVAGAEIGGAGQRDAFNVLVDNDLEILAARPFGGNRNDFLSACNFLQDGRLGCVGNSLSDGTPIGPSPNPGRPRGFFVTYDGEFLDLDSGMFFNEENDNTPSDFFERAPNDHLIASTIIPPVSPVVPEARLFRLNSETGEVEEIRSTPGESSKVEPAAGGQAWFLHHPTFSSGEQMATIERVDLDTKEVVDFLDIDGILEQGADVDPFGNLAVVGLAQDGFQQIGGVQEGHAGGFIDAFVLTTHEHILRALVSGASFGVVPVVPVAIYTAFYAPVDIQGVVQAQLSADNKFPKILEELEILFDGDPGALLFVSSTQAGVIAPVSVAGKDTVRVECRYKGELSNALEMPVAEFYPQFFTFNQSGSGPIAMLNQDNSVNSELNPAADGSVFQAFATGFGLLDGACGEDELAPTDRLLNSVNQFDVVWNSQVQQRLFQGASPGLACALGQFNGVTNTGAPAGAAPTLGEIFPDGFESGDTSAWFSSLE